jgi:hypothetical protein
MKTTMLLLLLGSLFGQTSAIFPCRTHCQDVCDNFVVGSDCWTNRGIFNPSQCGNHFPACKGKGGEGLFDKVVPCERSGKPQTHVQPAPMRTIVLGVFQKTAAIATYGDVL